MLKNVAIPLMLAAPAAEAQTKPSKAEVMADLNMDRKVPYPILIAAEAACTVASSTSTDGISTAAGTVGDKEALLATAKDAVTSMKAADGAWGLANAKRMASVAAAVAQEGASNIATLLDDVDTKAGIEREKAGLFAAADKLYQAGIRTKTAADAAVAAAATKLCNGTTSTNSAGATVVTCNATSLTGMKDTAVAAALAVRTQHAKESLWREWLYCELGGIPAGDTLPTGANGWWFFLNNDTGVDSSSNKIVTVGAAAAPAYCTVPEINNGATTGAVVDRPAVKYYPAKTTLTTEPDDGTSRWTAALLSGEAATALAAKSTRGGTMGSVQLRTSEGVVAWRKGDLRKASFTKGQR